MVYIIHVTCQCHFDVLYYHYLSCRCNWCIFLQEERELWYKRPCPMSLLKVMVLSVIHLQPLRLVLLDSLMTDYMALVDSYLSSCHYEPDGLAHVTMVRNSKALYFHFFFF